MPNPKSLFANASQLTLLAVVFNLPLENQSSVGVLCFGFVQNELPPNASVSDIQQPGFGSRTDKATITNGPD